jgi:hypothetical protein
LTSPDARETLRVSLESSPNSANLFDALISAMREALATALHDVFLMATFVALIAFCFALFLKEIPLRKRGQTTPATAVESGSERGQPRLAANANRPGGFDD